MKRLAPIAVLLVLASLAWAGQKFGGVDFVNGVTTATAHILGTADTNGIRLELDATDTDALAVREGDDSDFGPVFAETLCIQSLSSHANGVASPIADLTSSQMRIQNGRTLQMNTGSFLILQDDTAIYHGSGNDVLQEGELTTLTDGSATTVFSVVTADGDMAGLTITYTIQSTDGTDQAIEQGVVSIAISDLSGGVVASTPGETSVQALTGSVTMTSVWSVTTTDDQSLEVTLNADAVGMTPSTHQVRWHCTYSGDVSLTVP